MMACAAPMQTHEQKIQSLQHSILFLQSQHASTLSDLHKEIEKLQQRCSELTFQLTLSGVGGNGIQPGPVVKDVLEDEIRTIRQGNKELLCTVETKDKRILLLEGQLKSKEQRYHDDLKNIQRRIAELEHEMESKSNTIAYLTSQIQQNKLKYKPRNLDVNMVDNEGVEGGIDNNMVMFNPLPPTGSPIRRRDYNLRRSLTSPSASKAGIVQESSSHQLIASDYVLENSLPKTNSTRFSNRYKQSITDPARPSVGYSHSKRERDLKLATSSRPKPTDYEDFIKISQSQDIVQKSTIEPLPPITTRSGRQLREPIKTHARVLRSNKATANSRGEVETVIMDANLPSPERTYRKVQNTSK